MNHNHRRSSYGTVDGYNSPINYNEDEEDYLLNQHNLSPLSSQLPPKEQNKRWSVYDKLNNRHYLRVRNCSDFYDILTFKFLFNVCMLLMFCYLLYYAIYTLFLFNATSSNTYDYIIIGGGPAGKFCSFL